MTSTTDETVYGYSNVFTAMAALYLSNSEMWNNGMLPRMVEDCRGGGDWDDDRIAVHVGNLLKDYFTGEDNMPKLPSGGMYADLLTHALAKVDWTEIARTYLHD